MSQVTELEKNYLLSCEMVVDDLENHVKQCEQELDHYKKMVTFSEKQVEISTKRYKHERESFELAKKSYGTQDLPKHIESTNPEDYKCFSSKDECENWFCPVIKQCKEQFSAPLPIDYPEYEGFFDVELEDGTKKKVWFNIETDLWLEEHTHIEIGKGTSIDSKVIISAKYLGKS